MVAQPNNAQVDFNQLVREMETENAVGLMLAAQLGNTPAELTLVVRSAVMDAAAGSLRPVGQYMIRMVSLTEHKITLGLFNHAAWVDDHPLLYHHNAPGVRIFVTSAAANPESIVSQLDEAYLEMFGHWRTLDQDLNKRSDLHTVLTGGMGLLAETPKPFADEAVRLLTANGVSSTLIPAEPKIGHFSMMAFDNSYFVARGFTVEYIAAE